MVFSKKKNTLLHGNGYANAYDKKYTNIHTFFSTMERMHDRRYNLTMVNYP